MAFYAIKTFIGKFKPSRVKKVIFLSWKLHPFTSKVKPELIKSGFTNIRPYNKLTWKYYGSDRIRFTLMGYKNGKKYVIKFAKGFDEKMNNSIVLQSKFNDILDFIPKRGEIILNGYKCYFTEFIDSNSFSFAMKTANGELIDEFMHQANCILDALNTYKIVHCDLEEVNILVEKNSHKIYLIDWDTVCSSQLNLNCTAFPDCTIKKHVGEEIIYDDAYSFFTLFKRYVEKDILDKNFNFKSIKEKIGRNVHIVKE